MLAAATGTFSRWLLTGRHHHRLLSPLSRRSRSEINQPERIIHGHHILMLIRTGTGGLVVVEAARDRDGHSRRGWSHSIQRVRVLLLLGRRFLFRRNPHIFGSRRRRRRRRRRRGGSGRRRRRRRRERRRLGPTQVGNLALDAPRAGSFARTLHVRLATEPARRIDFAATFLARWRGRRWSRRRGRGGRLAAGWRRVRSGRGSGGRRSSSRRRSPRRRRGRGRGAGLRGGGGGRSTRRAMTRGRDAATAPAPIRTG